MEALITRYLHPMSYEGCWQMMRRFTDSRTQTSPDECWVVEHPPVFTLGQAASLSHLLDPKGIPVLRTDRGGEITYHGPGLIMFYVLIDCRRRTLNISRLIYLLEQSTLNLLESANIKGQRKPGAPGIYVNDAKVASLGLRVRKGCSYHGLCLNVGGNLNPFQQINPCGYQNLQVVSLQDLNVERSSMDVAKDWVRNFQELLLRQSQT